MHEPKMGFHPYHPDMSPELRKSPFPNPKLLKKLTLDLIKTYSICNPSFAYDPEKIPRRYLTIPSEGVFNEGYDNINHNYILRINDRLQAIRNNEVKTEYLILDFLGQGTFGQVVKCRNLASNELVAIKIIKNQKNYYNQGKSEVSILRKLNKKDQQRIVRLLDFFYFRFHLCLVFELLDVSLLDLLYSTEFKGIALSDIAFYTRQLLQGLIKAHEEKIIHCDIKPENILFTAQYSSDLKIIDFGSACFEKKATVSYIQSRHYRSPEVLLGDPYGLAIDMWSLGCVVAEMYLGLPIFPGNSDFDQMRRIIELMGSPSGEMIRSGKSSGKFFKFEDNRYMFKTRLEYELTENKKLDEPKVFRKLNKFENLIDYFSFSELRNQENKREELKNFDIFLDFLKDLLSVDPSKRIPASKAINHPFITELERFSEKIDVKLPFFENEEKDILRSLLRKKIKLSNRTFVPSENLMDLIHNPPPLHEASYNNIFQENPEPKPMKPLKRNEKNKAKKPGFKKQQFFNNIDNNINNNQPQQYYNMTAFYNNPLSVNNFNFETPQQPPLNYGMMPLAPPMNYQFLNAFYSNLNMNAYPAQPQQQMFFMGYGGNCDFYNRFANMKIGTPMNMNVETGGNNGQQQQWNGGQGFGEDNEGKKRNGFVKKSKYMKRKFAENYQSNADFQTSSREKPNKENRKN